MASWSEPSASNLGAGGPAMIEGGGLGRYEPTDIGPIDHQVAAGVVDVLVEDEAAATTVARRYLGYFQGARSESRRSFSSDPQHPWTPETVVLIGHELTIGRQRFEGLPLEPGR